MSVAALVASTTMVLLALAFVPGLEQPGSLPREVLVVLSAVTLLAVAVTGSPRQLLRTPAWLLLVPLSAGGIHLALSSGVAQQAMLRELVVLAAPWLVALGVREGDEASDSRALQVAASVALCAIGIVGLTQAWLGWSPFVQASPPAASFVNRNVAAQSLVILIPLSAAGLLRARPGWHAWLAGIGLGLGAAMVVATRSRGAWIALAVALLVVWAITLERSRSPAGRERFRITRAPVALALAFVALALVVPNRGGAPPDAVPSKLRSLTRPALGSGGERLALWRNSLALVREHPWLGAGPGRFTVEYPAVQSAVVPTPGFGLTRQPEHAHNDALEYAVELGLPAALALFALGALAAARALRAARRLAPARVAAWQLSLLAALVAAGIHGLVSFPLHSPASAFLAFCCVGLALPGASGRPRPRPLACILLLVLPLVGWGGWCELQAQRAVRQALDAAADGQCSAARVDAQRTLELAPWRARDVGFAAMVRFHCDPERERVLEAIEQALVLQPNQPNLLLAAGTTAVDVEQFDTARRAFEAALRIDSRLPQARAGLIHLAHVRGDAAAARHHCGLAREQAGFDARLRQLCGDDD